MVTMMNTHKSISQKNENENHLNLKKKMGQKKFTASWAI